MGTLLSSVEEFSARAEEVVSTGRQIAQNFLPDFMDEYVSAWVEALVARGGKLEIESQCTVGVHLLPVTDATVAMPGKFRAINLQAHQNPTLLDSLQRERIEQFIATDDSEFEYVRIGFGESMCFKQLSPQQQDTTELAPNMAPFASIAVELGGSFCGNGWVQPPGSDGANIAVTSLEHNQDFGCQLADLILTPPRVDRDAVWSALQTQLEHTFKTTQL